MDARDQLLRLLPVMVGMRAAAALHSCSLFSLDLLCMLNFCFTYDFWMMAPATDQIPVSEEQ